VRIEEPHVQPIPLHLHAPPDPTWWRTVVGRFDFTQPSDAPRADRIDRSGKAQAAAQQVWLLFSKHGGHLSFGSALNARISQFVSQR